MHLSLAACEALQGHDREATRALAEFRSLAPTVTTLSQVPWDVFMLAPPAIDRIKVGLRKAGMAE